MKTEDQIYLVVEVRRGMPGTTLIRKLTIPGVAVYWASPGAEIVVDPQARQLLTSFELRSTVLHLPGDGTMTKPPTEITVAQPQRVATAEDQAGRETTFWERATWGTCPACGAGPGQHCHAEIGFALGHRVDGQRAQTGDGAHLGRLQNAPRRVQLTAVLADTQ